MSDSAAAVREFDRHERDRWSGRASAYEASLGALCAFTAPLVLDAAGVAAGSRVIDAGTGPGTLARLAAERGALAVALHGESGMLELARTHLASAVFCEAVLPRLPVRGGWAGVAVANFVKFTSNYVGAASFQVHSITPDPNGWAIDNVSFPTPAVRAHPTYVALGDSYSASP